MNNQDLAQSVAGVTSTPPPGADEQEKQSELTETSDRPPSSVFKLLRGLPPFWHDRFVEAGLILSMGLYYVLGNPNLGTGEFLHLPPYLYSLPFLAIFACLSWYRLSFAVALLPLSLPYYIVQKPVFSHYSFSLIEISLYTCVLVAVGQMIVQGKRWRYRLSWTDLYDRLGPFLFPIAIFFLAALVSVVIALDHQTALRAFREEVFGPLFYVWLAFSCLRTRQDVKRLCGAFLGCAFVVALVGLIQYFFFANQLQASIDGGRVHAMYGSANSIGLFFDYAVPIGLALLVFQIGKALKAQEKWWISLLLLVSFVPLIGVLYFSQSLGTALALPVAFLFILALSLRSRRLLLIGTAALIVLVAVVGIALSQPIAHFIATWHDNSKGISTISKRYYLWATAWRMIQARPLQGFGMDNWLCYYSLNNVCQLSSAVRQHYWVTLIPGTNLPTGLRDEPTLSHPHDIFLHVWVSMGIFGLLAFVAILVLFFWLFARILKTVRRTHRAEVGELKWVVLGVGSALLAALGQGLIDSAFLEQDLAFCFWMLVATLLILRILTSTSWWGKAVG